jgi:hypothetical protein
MENSYNAVYNYLKNFSIEEIKRSLKNLISYKSEAIEIIAYRGIDKKRKINFLKEEIERLNRLIEIEEDGLKGISEDILDYIFREIGNIDYHIRDNMDDETFIKICRKQHELIHKGIAKVFDYNDLRKITKTNSIEEAQQVYDNIKSKGE